MSSYSTKPSSTSNASTQQVVGIQSVDLIGMSAQGVTRNQTTCTIDLRYHTGAVHVIPVVGDQWIVKWFANTWILSSQLAHNTTELAAAVDNPVQGLVQIGSSSPDGQGPLHLNGSTVVANAPLQVQAVATSARPSPSSVKPGTHIWDATLKKPIWSDGSVWTDATGATV